LRSARESLQQIPNADKLACRCTISVAMLTASLNEIRELCARITEEPNTAKLVPMLAKLRKLLAALQVSTSKIESR
jgi:hypothetical protein